MLKTDYEIWANELIGFQGGNRDSNLWFCGLEYQEDRIDELISKYKSGRILDYLTDNQSKSDVESERFNRAILKLANHLSIKKDTESSLFTKSSSIYKINLFPPGLAKTYDDYPQIIQKQLGIQSKKDLRNLLKKGVYTRLQKLREIAIKKNRIVICCSRGEANTFKKAFVGDRHAQKTLSQSNPDINIKLNTAGKNNKYITIFHYKIEGKDIVLAIVPFLSGHASSPNSEEIISIRTCIRDYLVKNKLNLVFRDICY